MSLFAECRSGAVCSSVDVRGAVITPRWILSPPSILVGVTYNSHDVDGVCMDVALQVRSTIDDNCLVLITHGVQLCVQCDGRLGVRHRCVGPLASADTC